MLIKVVGNTVKVRFGLICASPVSQKSKLCQAFETMNKRKTQVLLSI